MPDPHEAVREDMQEEPPEKLLGRERHELQATPVGIVLPAEAHLVVVDTEEPVVGERHTVGVAAEVLQDLCGAGERRLGVDNPVRRPTRGEERR